MEVISSNELFKKAQQGSEEALNILYQQNKNLIYSILKRYNYQSQDQEDLVSSGSIGLIKAIKNFNVDLNLCFSTYAVPLILGEIRKYFREKNGLKVSRGLKEKGAEVQKFIENYLSKNQEEPSIETIGKNCNLSDEEVIMALEAGYQVTSLDKTHGEDNDTDLKDLIGEDNQKEIIDKMDVELALSVLTSKERLFVELRYYENLTQQEIAERFFINQVAISRMEKKILEKMRKKLLQN